MTAGMPTRPRWMCSEISFGPLLGTGPDVESRGTNKVIYLNGATRYAGELTCSQLGAGAKRFRV